MDATNDTMIQYVLIFHFLLQSFLLRPFTEPSLMPEDNILSGDKRLSIHLNGEVTDIHLPFSTNIILVAT